MSERLRLIAAKEQVEIADSAVEAIIDVSEGDLRRAITLLQSLSRLKSCGSLDKAAVEDMTGRIPSRCIEKFYRLAAGKMNNEVQAFIEEEVIREGYTASRFLGQLLEFLIAQPTVDDMVKSEIIDEMAVCEHRLCEGGSEELQLMAVGQMLLTLLDYEDYVEEEADAVPVNDR